MTKFAALAHQTAHTTSAQGITVQLPDRTGLQKLDIEKISDGPMTCLRVNGAITEKLDGKKLAAGIKAKFLVVDFSGVSNISSFGIREWIAFNRAIERSIDKVYLIGCSPALMHEIQVVTDFVGKGLLFSFFAPYVCEHCDTSRQVLLNVDRDAEAIQNMQAPELHCETCGNAEVFDEDPGSFFAHVSQQKAFEIDPKVVSFLVANLGYLATDLAVRVQADKYVEDRNVYLRMIGDLGSQFSPERLGEGLQGTVIIDVTGANCSSAAGAVQFQKLVSIASLSSDRVLIHGCQSSVLEALPKDDPKLQILSTSLPYKCSSCAISGSELLDVQKHHHVFSLGMPPKLQCKSCGQPTAFAAGSDVLSHLSSLPKPDIDAKLRKFIEHAQKRKPKVEKKRAANEVGPASSRTLTYGIAAGVALTVALVGMNYYLQKQSSDEMRNAVERIKQPSTSTRPGWITSDLSGSAYCTPHTNQTTCIGVSSYARDEQEGRREAWNGAIDGLVHLVGLNASDPLFAKHVRKRYSEARQTALGAVQPGVENANNVAEQKVKTARESVAKAFARTGGDAAPSQMSDWYWEKYEARGGQGHEYLVFVRVDIATDVLDKLVKRYSQSVDAAGAKVVTTFPALAWSAPADWDGVNVLEVGKGPLLDAGVREGDVILSIGDDPVRSSEDFAEIVAQAPKGPLRLRVARGAFDVLALPAN